MFSKSAGVLERGSTVVLRLPDITLDGKERTGNVGHTVKELVETSQMKKVLADETREIQGFSFAPLEIGLACIFIVAQAGD